MSDIRSTRALNRALLARQMLLTREPVAVTDAIERLVGQQAQAASSPYIGLWSRLAGFTRDDLAREIEARRVVKATLMRGTLHLMTTDDYLRLRGTIQEALSVGQQSIAKQRGHADLDIDTVVEIGRAFMAEAPRTFSELSKHLESLYPDTDPGAMRYTVRTHLPMVQVPTETHWSYPGTAKFTLAETWLGTPIPDTIDLPALVRRYLAAFGPAGVTDMQKWSGLPKLGPLFASMRDELTVVLDGKRELFDLPDMPMPAPDTPAPVRFLPEFDNILLSHTNRTRIVAPEHEAAIIIPGNLRFRPSVLIDGFVAATWTSETKRGTATLTVTPFAPLSTADRAAVTEEAEALVRFVEPSAKSFAVAIAG